MDPRSTRQVTLYSRPGCHLCEDTADLLERLAARLPLAVVEVNILEDAELFERYKHRIPVVMIADGPMLSAPIGAADLLEALAADGSDR